MHFPIDIGSILTHWVLWQACLRASFIIIHARLCPNKHYPHCWELFKRAANAGNRRHPAQRSGHQAHAAAAGPGGPPAGVRLVR